MQAWLYRDFKLWFGVWLLALFSSLILYKYNEDMAVLLLRFLSTLLVALLTAMAAFDHMNTNERKKLAREEYFKFSSLLSALDERYQHIMNIRDSYMSLFNIDKYQRGLTPPFIVLHKNIKDFDTSSIGFLLKLQRNSANQQELGEIKKSGLNPEFIRKIFTDYSYVMQLIEHRNNIFEKDIIDILDKNYTGSGSTNIPLNLLKYSGFSYVRLTNFLMLTEAIMKQIDGCYHDYRQVIDSLGKNAKKVIDPEVAKENYGYSTMAYSFENDKYKYIKLSDSEMKKMNLRDYPESTDYTQKCI